MLFFGARTAAELPYFGPLTRLPKDFIDIHLAFSRVPQQPRQYVQDLIRLRGEEVARMLQDANTYLYICGLKGMENGVDAAFSEVCQRKGLDWGMLRNEMRQQGRYHVETY
jgi:benzoyl-CoA 2,3-dioxygenase component A